MKNSIIYAKDVEKIYGSLDSGYKALKGVDLSINRGDFICIMGPSGSGKSTFINVISSLDVCTSGKVVIKGKNVKAMGESEIAKFRYDNIGFIFQEFNLIDELNIRENIGLTLVAAGKSKKEIREKVLAISKKVGIEEILEKYPWQCSGRQKQRAATARALVNNPELIIADEPTGNLDTKNSHEFLAMIREMNIKENKTILMVTHDSMIASYSKTLLFLRDGKIDEIVEKGDKSQMEFYKEIMNITSKESEEILEIMNMGNL